MKGTGGARRFCPGRGAPRSELFLRRFVKVAIERPPTDSAAPCRALSEVGTCKLPDSPCPRSRASSHCLDALVRVDLRSIRHPLRPLGSIPTTTEAIRRVVSEIPARGIPAFMAQRQTIAPPADVPAPTGSTTTATAWSMRQIPSASAPWTTTSRRSPPECPATTAIRSGRTASSTATRAPETIAAAIRRVA